MAEIKPFRAWRYHKRLTPKIGSLLAPLSENISATQRNQLYANPLNSVHLSLPKEKGDALASVAQRVKKWKEQGILVQDLLPTVYVYYQHFTNPKSKEKRSRKGFIANLKIYDWDEKVVLGHENTIPFSVRRRLEILDSTKMNVCPTHGLYSDPTNEVESYLDHAIEHPIYENVTNQGVREVLALIHDVKTIKKIMRVLADKQLILADGHHRYQGSLTYKKHKEKINVTHSGKEGYNYHMMYFTNSQSADLEILPTHRLIKNLSGFDSESFIEKLKSYFSIVPLGKESKIDNSHSDAQHRFELLLPRTRLSLRLKPKLIRTMHWDFPPEIKTLDLTVLHYFIIEKALGIPGKSQRSSRNIFFETDVESCQKQVNDGEAQCAVLTKGISMDTIKKVCHSGYTLPQKSTHFYPKISCGFLFSSLADQDPNSVFDEAF